MREIICSKCGSEGVENFAKEKPEVKEVSMEEFVKQASQVQAVNAVMVYTTMILLCKDCGYRLEYTI